MLYVKGFCKQRVFSSQQIIDAIAKVPKAHLEGLEYIVYDPERFFQRTYVEPRSINYKVLGQYSKAPKKFISIHAFNSKKEFYHILYHEIGHHVFNHILPSKKRVEWVCNIYPNSDFFVSNYASKNAQEDFCESYSCFFTNFNNLLKDKNKAAFMRNFMTPIVR